MNQAFDFWRMWDRLGWTGKDAAVECDVGLLDSFYVGGEPQGEMQIEVLSNRAFRVGYSEKWRSPLWVAYRLDRVEEFKWGRRPSSFRVEKRVDERVSAQDRDAIWEGGATRDVCDEQCDCATPVAESRYLATVGSGCGPNLCATRGENLDSYRTYFFGRFNHAEVGCLGA
jgi:hypothetical protein